MKRLKLRSTPPTPPKGRKDLNDTLFLLEKRPLRTRSWSLSALYVLCGRKLLRDARDLLLLTVCERPYDGVSAVVAAKDRRHRLELADVEEVHQERRDDVVAVVPERDLCAPLLDRYVIQNAAPKPRAQRAIRIALRD